MTTAAAAQKVSGEITQQSKDEQDRFQQLRSHALELLPKFGHQWNTHSLVVMRRQTLSRIIYYHDLYQKMIGVPGVICEFGVQWGATLTTLINLRGMYEPFNHSRKIVGFDTFEGFLDVDKKDGALVSRGDYSTSENYEATLDRILSLQESFSPLPHIKKFELVKGDVGKTLPKWLKENPHAIVSMAIFDLDVFKPTKIALEKILPRLTRGSLLVFDELNCPQFPGETAALQEVLGVNKIALRHNAHQPYCAWAVYEG